MIKDQITEDLAIWSRDQLFKWARDTQMRFEAVDRGEDAFTVMSAALMSIAANIVAATTLSERQISQAFEQNVVKLRRKMDREIEREERRAKRASK